MMDVREKVKSVTTFVLAALVLALTVSFRKESLLWSSFLTFLLIIGINIVAKKIAGYYFETNVKHKFWSWYYFGFRKDSHFKTPLPMIWLPLLISLFSRGALWWLSVLEFDVEAKSERVSRRHGLYRYTQVTEWHMAWIAIWGIVGNIALAVLSYLAGFETMAKLSMYYAMWSAIPLSSLDGSKILFGSRALWITVAAVLLIIFGWGLAI
jgi:hypothetical protein